MVGWASITSMTASGTYRIRRACSRDRITERETMAGLRVSPAGETNVRETLRGREPRLPKRLARMERPRNSTAAAGEDRRTSASAGQAGREPDGYFGSRAVQQRVTTDIGPESREASAASRLAKRVAVIGAVEWHSQGQQIWISGTGMWGKLHLAAPPGLGAWARAVQGFHPRVWALSVYLGVGVGQEDGFERPRANGRAAKQSFQVSKRPRHSRAWQRSRRGEWPLALPSASAAAAAAASIQLQLGE